MAALPAPPPRPTILDSHFQKGLSSRRKSGWDFVCLWGGVGGSCGKNLWGSADFFCWELPGYKHHSSPHLAFKNFLNFICFLLALFRVGFLFMLCFATGEAVHAAGLSSEESVIWNTVHLCLPCCLSSRWTQGKSWFYQLSRFFLLLTWEPHSFDNFLRLWGRETGSLFS